MPGPEASVGVRTSAVVQGVAQRARLPRDAGRSGREDLAGVQDALRVEDAGDLALQLPLVVAELVGEPAPLQHLSLIHI